MVKMKKIISILTIAWLISSGSCYGDLPRTSFPVPVSYGDFQGTLSPVPVSFGQIHVYVDNEDSKDKIDAKEVTFGKYLRLRNKEFRKRTAKICNTVKRASVYGSIGIIIYYTCPGLRNSINGSFANLSTTCGEFFKNSTLGKYLIVVGKAAWFLTRLSFKFGWSVYKYVTNKKVGL